MQQGEKGTCAYLIEEGSVEIEIADSEGCARKVGTRGPGSIIGEMAMLDDLPRVATIRALENCHMIEITREDFARRLDHADPVLRMVSQVILTRYRDMLMRSELRSESAAFPPPDEVERTLAMEADTVDQIKLANELREAMNNGDLELYYQPILNLQDNVIQGFEALMRWDHPERGFVSPGIFIPIAEDTGLILESSAWALEEACRALKRIERASGFHDELYMSVNFSSADFSSDNFVEGVYATLSATDVQARNICLEITERILMDQPDTARDTLEMCRKAGMGIAIDDFGTGYSSLSYLHTFPIQTLKIDRSFIRDMMKNETIYELVRSIVGLGKNLKMHVTAEGIESPEESKALRDFGCDSAQGFYFARPMPEKDVIRLLAQWKDTGAPV